MGRRWFVILGVTVIVAAALVLIMMRRQFLQTSHVASETKISIGATTLFVTEALTPEQQTQGLSDTTSLDQNAGMLFDFGGDKTPLMWMKDMHYGLDFIWVDSQYHVVGVTPDVSPATYPSTFSPPTPCRYVIEVNAGWAAAHHIAVGDQLQL